MNISIMHYDFSIYPSPQSVEYWQNLPEGLGYNCKSKNTDINITKNIVEFLNQNMIINIVSATLFPKNTNVD